MALTRPKYSNIQDTDWKQSCRVATIGSNITLSGSAPNTIDGVTLKQFDRILVKDQTDKTQNGIYYVTTVGTGSNGTWARATDANTSEKVSSGLIVSITEGTTLAGNSYKLVTPDPITLDTTQLTFSVWGAGGGGSAGGSDGQIQYNNLNAFAGAPGVTTDGSSITVSSNVSYGGTVLTSTITTTVGTASKVIDTFSLSSYRSAKYIISVTDVVDLEYQTNEIVLVHNGTTPTISSYGLVYTGTTQRMTFSANIVNGNVTLWGTGVSANNTVKLSRTLIPV